MSMSMGTHVNVCHKRFNSFFGKQDFSKMETQLLNFHVCVKVVKSQNAFSVWSHLRKDAQNHSPPFFSII